jgi:hypothetical protein
MKVNELIFYRLKNIFMKFKTAVKYDTVCYEIVSFINIPIKLRQQTQIPRSIFVYT